MCVITIVTHNLFDFDIAISAAIERWNNVAKNFCHEFQTFNYDEKDNKLRG